MQKRGEGEEIAIRVFVRLQLCKNIFLLLAFIDATISSKSSFAVVCPAFIKVYYYGLLRIAGFIVIALLHPTSYYSAISFIVYCA